MTELTVTRLRELLSEQTNRAAKAERRERDLQLENAKLRRRMAAIQSLLDAGERRG